MKLCKIISVFVSIEPLIQNRQSLNDHIFSKARPLQEGHFSLSETNGRCFPTIANAILSRIFRFRLEIS